MSSTPVHIIAEAGTNHNGILAHAYALVDLACSAGADSVKFQIIDPDFLYLPGTYPFGRYDINAVREMRRRFMLTDEAYVCICKYARGKNIPFSASVFDDHGLDFLCSLAPPYIKIASTDLNNIRFLRTVASKRRRILLSTGMSTLSDIEKSVAEITTNGFNDIVLIHCVSTYPSRLRDMNLRFIELLHSTFGFPVGLSDHTESSIAACMALCTGVSYIEKHITMDRSQEGFDHAYACEGDAFIRYVQDIRDAEAALRTPAEKISHSEHTVRERARRGLYAARDMHTGETVTDPDILVLRPQSVMAADQITDIVGKILAMPVRRFEPFNPGQFAQHGQ